MDFANALKKFVIFPRNERASEHVAVAAKIFRGRIHHEIRAKAETARWIIGHQVLSTTRRAPAVCAISATAARSVNFNVGLDGVSTQMSLVFWRTAFLIASRSVISTKSTASRQRAKTLAEQLQNAVVGFARSNHMIVWRERLESGGRRRQTRSEGCCCRPSLENRKRLFEAGPIRVTGTRIAEARRIASVCGTLKSGGEMNRPGHRARRRIDRAARVHRDRFGM